MDKSFASAHMSPLRLASNLRLQVPNADTETEFTGERFVPGLTGEMELEHLHRYLISAPLCAGRDVLDVACGQGYGSAILAQTARSVVGVDIDSPTIERAGALYRAENLRFLAGDCVTLPIPSRSTDVVVSFETIEHITQHEGFLAEIRRVLRDDGMLVMSTPDKVEYNRQIPAANPHHVRELTRDEFETLLRTFFMHVRFARQRTLFASALVSEEPAHGEAPVLFATQQKDGGVAFSAEPVNGVYLLVLATNSVAQTLGNSFFEGSVTPNYFGALRGGITERDLRIIALTDRVGALTDRVGSLEGGITERDEQIVVLRTRVNTLEASLADQNCKMAQLERESDGIRQRLHGIVHSRSWRLTGPLRQVSQLARQFLSFGRAA